jgi:uncharacterized protein
MDEERQRAIASKGGQRVPNEKRSFSRDRELASAAGRKGGQARGRRLAQSSGENVNTGGISTPAAPPPLEHTRSAENGGDR